MYLPHYKPVLVHIGKPHESKSDSILPADLPGLPDLQPETAANTSILPEAFAGIEALLLHLAPVYYGWGVPHGDGSAVIVIPCFMGFDLYMFEMFAWLRRIGYSPYYSGIGMNAECPNLLIQRRLNATLDQALEETGRPVHLIGHSLGGVIARSWAEQRPEDVRSVITLGSPFKGAVAHKAILALAEFVRQMIQATHGSAVLPDCYTGKCTCDFLMSLRRGLPSSVSQTAIFSRGDGVVDADYCKTSCADHDIEVSGTHMGLIFNASVYEHIACRLAHCT